MFHEISERLVTWASDVAGEPIATLGPPSTGASTRRIGLSLVDVIPHPAPDTEATRLKVSLRYLATVSAETPIEAHRLLGLLTFAAMSRPDLAVDLERPSMQFWLALGVAPQPCVSLRVTAWKACDIRPTHSGERTVDRRQMPDRLLPRGGCAFQRRATDRRPPTLSIKSEVKNQMSAWRDRC
ncbi:MAG: hypothetical protein ABI634_08480 [Acidobacteriota bacterium]